MDAESDGQVVLDLSRAPRGEFAATQLVASVAALGDLAERHYLELKGPADLSNKESKQKIAKFILGAANRMPERAAEAFEGYGVMVIGVTASGVVGVPPIEMLALSQVVQPFLGANGPRWDIVRVRVADSSNEVILVLVDPPEPGQPPFVCRGNGHGLQDGRIYYRADGETREANSGEIDLLMARGAAAPRAAVELEVSVVGEVLPFVVDDERTIEEYLRLVREKLLSAMPSHQPPTTPRNTTIEIDAVSGESGLAGLGLDAAAVKERMAEVLASSVGATLGTIYGAVTVPEKRTEQEYVEEIEEWEREFRAAWPAALERFASMSLEPNEVKVVNRAQTFFRDLEVSVHLDGPVEAMERRYPAQEGPDWSDLHLPYPPRLWGPTMNRANWPFSNSLGLDIAARSAMLPLASQPYLPPDASWTNGGSVDVEVQVGQLRQEKSFTTADANTILIVRGEVPPVVQGTWRATDPEFNEVFQGEIQVRVANSEALTDLLREFLEID